MIKTGFYFIAFVMAFLSVILVVASKYKLKIFKILPPIVIIYIGAMAMYTFGVWELNEEVKASRASIIGNIVPAMVFIMALKCNVKDIAKLGPRLVATFLTATVTIFIGFVIAFTLMHGFLLPDSANAFGTIGAGWTGGTQNFLAVKEALQVGGDAFTYTLLMGSINYSIWIMILVLVAQFMPRFNSWTRTNTEKLDTLISHIKISENRERPSAVDLLLVLSLSLIMSALAQYLSSVLPTVWIINASIWKILIVTVAGLILAVTRIGQLRGIGEISTIMLYVVLVFTATNVNLAALLQAPLYVLTGAMILVIHGVLLVLAAKVFKWDLYTCGIASIANVGGVASAPIVAAVYDESLVTIAVLMGALGATIGTFAGLFIANILNLIA